MVHSGLKRAAQARLYDPDQRKSIRRALEELLIHAVKYVFVPDLGPPARGMPTAHAAPVLKNDSAYDAESAYVWPDANGHAKGIELSPLSKSAPTRQKWTRTSTPPSRSWMPYVLAVPGNARWLRTDFSTS